MDTKRVGLKALETWQLRRVWKSDAAINPYTPAVSSIVGDGDIDGDGGNDNGNVVGLVRPGWRQVLTLGLAEGYWRVCQVCIFKFFLR